MPEMPTLGQSHKSSNPLAGVAIAAIVVGLIVGGVYWWKHRGAVETMPTPVAAAVEPVAPAVPSTEAVPVGTPNAAVPTAPAIAAVAPAPPTKDLGGMKSLHVTINGPMESAIIAGVGKAVGAPLTQVVNRTLVWWIKVPNDLVKGDALQVIYEERGSQEPLVHAVRFTSSKLGKTMEAYRFKPDDQPFPRFYAPDGKELEERLVDGPLDNWEQITSLLKDGRKHKGVDFKTPVGTPVKATFDGTIERKTWAFRGNGNSLDIAESGGKGRHAYYLHLSELPKTVAVGQKVKKGQVIAQSGNTGHSFAPHLHYQLVDAGGNVIDPFDSHQVTRASIDPKQLPKLTAEVARLNKLFESTAALAGGR